MNDTLFLAKPELSYYDSSMIGLLRQFNVIRHALADEASRLREILGFFRTDEKGKRPKELEYGSEA